MIIFINLVGGGYLTFNTTVCGVSVKLVCELLLNTVYIRWWSDLLLGVGSILPSISQCICRGRYGMEQYKVRYGIGVGNKKSKCAIEM